LGGRNGYFRVRREVAFFEANRAREHELIGRAVSVAVSAVWKSEGQDSALRAIDGANEHFHRIHIQWRGVGEPRAPACETMPTNDTRYVTCITTAGSSRREGSSAGR
jgi:hypothetical protein